MLFRDRAIINLESVDSTNNYAANLVRLSQPPEGTVITAQHQTSGRGQRHASWESTNGENLLCSIILYPKFIQAINQFSLSQAIALSVRELVENEIQKEVSIKWPNDIIVENKKIAGILIENSWMDARLNSCICGIGINLNQMHFETSNAISVRYITKRIWDVNDCLVQFIDILEKYYLRLKSENYVEISNAYHSHLFRKDIRSRFIFENNEIEATILGVDLHGRLKIQPSAGEIVFCDLKEIAMIL
jgi:BirA family transcriptional regulator, biotin operon repressor / biotin---[acetyl-CoA-carboxylase] ligase